MKKTIYVFNVIGGIVFACLSLASAAAGVWTPAQTISQIDEYGGGFRVSGPDLGGNPANCTYTTTALPDTANTDSKLNRFNSILLAAFMASKQVMLKISDTICTENNPTYYAVRILP